MENEIKRGDYIRTKKGSIGQVIDVTQWHKSPRYLIHWDIGKVYYITNLTIIKNSPNLIDIIEERRFN